MLLLYLIIIIGLLPFGTEATDDMLPQQLDAFSAGIFLNKPFPYFGTEETVLFVRTQLLFLS